MEHPWSDRPGQRTLRFVRDAVGAACGRLTQAYLERDWEMIEALCVDLRELWEAVACGAPPLPQDRPNPSEKTPQAGERTRTSSQPLTPLPCSSHFRSPVVVHRAQRH